jgi:heat shock protein HslJ
MRTVRPRIAILVVLLALLAGACSSSGSSGLVGKIWQWTASSLPNATTISNPSSYTIVFGADGTFSSRVDCNQLAGTYTTSGSNGISIEPGPMTLALCPNGSLDQVFIAGISAATTYAIAGGQLTLTAPNGTMTFQ